MPTTELLVIIALVVLMAIYFVINMLERAKILEAASKERAEMMNRIISKDAREYAMLTRVSAPVDDRSVYNVKEVDDVAKDDGLGMPVA
jgi:hypothetical protein